MSNHREYAQFLERVVPVLLRRRDPLVQVVEDSFIVATDEQVRLKLATVPTEGATAKTLQLLHASQVPELVEVERTYGNTLVIRINPTDSQDKKNQGINIRLHSNEFTEQVPSTEDIINAGNLTRSAFFSLLREGIDFGSRQFKIIEDEYKWPKYARILTLLEEERQAEHIDALGNVEELEARKARSRNIDELLQSLSLTRDDIPTIEEALRRKNSLTNRHRIVYLATREHDLLKSQEDSSETTATLNELLEFEGVRRDTDDGSDLPTIEEVKQELKIIDDYRRRIELIKKVEFNFQQYFINEVNKLIVAKKDTESKKISADHISTTEPVEIIDSIETALNFFFDLCLNDTGFHPNTVRRREGQLRSGARNVEVCLIPIKTGDDATPDVYICQVDYPAFNKSTSSLDISKSTPSNIRDTESFIVTISPDDTYKIKRINNSTTLSALPPRFWEPQINKKRFTSEHIGLVAEMALFNYSNLVLPHAALCTDSNTRIHSKPELLQIFHTFGSADLNPISEDNLALSSTCLALDRAGQGEYLLSGKKFTAKPFAFNTDANKDSKKSVWQDGINARTLNNLSSALINLFYKKHFFIKTELVNNYIRLITNFHNYIYFSDEHKTAQELENQLSTLLQQYNTIHQSNAKTNKLLLKAAADATNSILNLPVLEPTDESDEFTKSFNTDEHKLLVAKINSTYKKLHAAHIKVVKKRTDYLKKHYAEMERCYIELQNKCREGEIDRSERCLLTCYHDLLALSHTICRPYQTSTLGKIFSTENKVRYVFSLSNSLSALSHSAKKLGLPIHYAKSDYDGNGYASLSTVFDTAAGLLSVNKVGTVDLSNDYQYSLYSNTVLKVYKFGTSAVNTFYDIGLQAFNCIANHLVNFPSNINEVYMLTNYLCGLTTRKYNSLPESSFILSIVSLGARAAQVTVNALLRVPGLSIVVRNPIYDLSLKPMAGAGGPSSRERDTEEESSTVEVGTADEDEETKDQSSRSTEWLVNPTLARILMLASSRGRSCSTHSAGYLTSDDTASGSSVKSTASANRVATLTPYFSGVTTDPRAAKKRVLRRRGSFRRAERPSTVRV